MANKNNINVITIDTGLAQTSVKELRTQLKELRNTMLSAKEGTDEYNKALTQAAEITHKLKEQTEYINATAMDFGQIVSNVNGALGGFVGGLQAVKASMSLLGVENEDVLKSLEKMQNLMAITQALPAIDKGIKAFNKLGIAIKGAAASMTSFKAALVTTGIGAVVVALGYLAANWDKVTEAMRKWGIIHEDTEKKMKEQTQALDDWRKTLEKVQSELYNQETADKVAKMNTKTRKTYDEITQSLKNLEVQYKKVEADRQVEWNTNGKYSAQARELTATFDDLTVQINALHKQQLQLLNDASSYTPDPEPMQTWVKEIAQTTKEALSSLDPFISLQDKLSTTSAYEIPVKIVVEEGEDAVEDEIQKHADEIRNRIESTILSLRNAFKTPEEQYQEEISALQTALNTKLISQEEYYRLVDQLNREQTAREIERWQVAASSIGAIFTSLGDLMEEGSEEQKALQIMGATINMLAGITAAVSGLFTTKTGPWDIALAALQATAIAASGAATIAKMANTTKSNAKSSSYSVATGAINSLTAPVQYTQDVQGASIEGAIKNTRVYVTEGDISSTQHKVDVAESEAIY